MENLFLDLSGKFSFSVFQSLRKYSEMSPEIFRNSSVSKTEKLKNRKTEKLNPYGESLPGSLWKIHFFCFSVFQFLRKYSEMSPEIFRNSSVSKTEKQKNRKTESIWRISSWISLENSVFSFSVFTFSVSPKIFRNVSGNIPE